VWIGRLGRAQCVRRDAECTARAADHTGLRAAGGPDVAAGACGKIALVAGRNLEGLKMLELPLPIATVRPKISGSLQRRRCGFTR